MATDNDILRRICDFFIQSSAFNGISVDRLADALSLPHPELQTSVGRLVVARQVDLAFSSHSANPHIMRVPALPIDEQLVRLARDEPSTVCAYPASTVLRPLVDLQPYSDRPYAARLALAAPQLTPVFFELSVLERYFSDPRYRCHFGDYQGSISVEDEHYRSPEMPEQHKVLLQTFGIGYDQVRQRVVVAFLRYLADLSPEHQQLWKLYEVSGPCVMNSDYERSAIWGDWPVHHSVYQAFIQEQVELNKLAALIGKPGLFVRTFEDDARPLEFSPMLRPTQKNLERFIHTLDKMLSENITREFFRGDIPLEEHIKAADGTVERRNLGTLNLLARWLSQHYRTQDGHDVAKEVLAPLREVRDLRQRPAHALGQDTYDPEFPQQQDELLGKVVLTLRTLRLILTSHPMAAGYVGPGWLDSDKIVFY
jgi:hypothetical protein